MNIEMYENIADFSFLEEREDDHHSSCPSEEEEEQQYEEEEDEDSVEHLLLHRPIVVGYSFGPKKMSTMGVVMAEASKTRLNTNMFQDVLEQQQQQHEEEVPTNAIVSDPNPRTVSELEAEEDEIGSKPILQADEDANHQHQVHPAAAVTAAAASNWMLTKEALSSFGKQPPQPRPFATTTARTTAISETRSSSSKHKKHFSAAPPTSVLFSLDHSYLNNNNNSGSTYHHRSLHHNNASTNQTATAIVRHWQDSPPSTSSWGSTGTRTASTAASFRTVSAGGTGSITGSTTLDSSARSSSRQSRRRRHGDMIRVAFVPLDPEIPLSEQHGGMDVILHKLTEDILVLSQLSCQYPSLNGILQLPRESAMEKVLECLPEESDRAAIRRVFRLCQFQKQHGCYLVDDPVAVLTLMSRADIARVLQKCLKDVTSASGISVKSPNYAVVVAPSPTTNNNGGGDAQEAAKTKNDAAYKAVLDAQLSFPLIVKPLTAAGTKASHAMAVVTHPSGLPRATDRIPSCLLQEYANHNATLYKVYVLGEFVSVHKRRSLPNLPSNTNAASPPVVEFDSQRPYPRLRDFGYPSSPSTPTRTLTTCQQQHQNQDPLQSLDDIATELTPSEGGSKPITTEGGKKQVPTDLVVTAEEVKPIAEALKQAFGLQIFGFDILITTTTASSENNNEQQQPTMLVVDVNYFPSYKEVPNFPALLAKYLTGRAIASRLEKTKHGGSH